MAERLATRHEDLCPKHDFSCSGYIVRVDGNTTFTNNQTFSYAQNCNSAVFVVIHFDLRTTTYDQSLDRIRTL